MPVYKRVVIVGVGLLGGSVGLALLHRQLAKEVVGVGRDLSKLEQARQLSVITQVSTDLAAACCGADLVVIGTPVQSIAPFVRQACSAELAESCLITDVGSTKATICNELSSREHQRFCGSHPMAGGEKSGAAHASATLFVGKRTIVTPAEHTPAAVVAATEQLWLSLGADVVCMSPQVHDEVVAKVSHLPHVLASALAACTETRLLPMAAAGWCDTTRVAAGDPEMWRQIIHENRAPVLAALQDYSASLAEWIMAIERDDSARLLQLLTQGKQTRDAVSPSDSSTQIICDS